MPKLEDEKFNKVNTDETVDTGDAQGKRPADKKNARDKEADKLDAKEKATMKVCGSISEESVKELFADVEGLSEDFAGKAATLLEGAMSERLSVIKKEYEALIEENVKEAVAEIQEDYLNKIDSFITYVAENYIKENELAIASGIREEIAEEIVNSIRDVVESYGVELPVEKVDIADALAEEVAHTEKELSRVMNENISLTKKIQEYEVKDIFEEVASDLTDAGKEKLSRLTENITYSSSDEYKRKVLTLKESVTNVPEKTEELNEQVQRQPLKEDVNSNVSTDEDARKSQILKTMKDFL